MPPDAINARTYEALLELAEALKGTPYKMVWDANDPANGYLDCSGFMQYIYKTTGVYDSMPRTAQEQYNVCTPISKDELKEGDLVFFTGTYDTTSPVTHVGMYIGNGEFIHAASAGVGTANLNWGYYQEHFYGYGRLPS